MFSHALFIIARKWNHPGYPSSNECIKKIGYIHVKKNRIIKFSGKWLKLGNTPSEVDPGQEI